MLLLLMLLLLLFFCQFVVLVYLLASHQFLVQYIYNIYEYNEFNSMKSSEFKVRFRNHKSAMSTKKTTCEVAVHFNKEKHQLSDFKFIVTEQICNIDDKHNVGNRLLTREAFWCFQLCTLRTYGLNKRSEFNSKNRMKYN